MVLNDYRNAEIDAATLALPADRVTPLAGMCICCGSQDELIRALQAADTRPGQVVLLEANGTADTTEIIELLTADRRLSHYTLPVQVTVVDAERWQNRGQHNELERMQVQTARYLVPTHSDRRSEDRRVEMERSLRAIAPRSRIVDTGALVGIVADLAAADSSPGRHRFHSGEAGPSTHIVADVDPHRARHHFSSVEITPSGQVDEALLRRVLAALPEEVLRVKGVVRLAGSDHPMYVQRTDRPRSVDLVPLRGAENLDSVLILIGVALDEELLASVLPSDWRR